VGTSKQDCTSLPNLESFVRIVNLTTKQAVLEGEREREKRNRGTDNRPLLQAPPSSLHYPLGSSP
jgi:hypothetical protein